jgi:2-polyprenyl-6-methoxyphenol hydroxylase-like FAD-dependent oxidoreductase
MSDDVVDVIVMGAGPVGLSAAARVVRDGLTVAVVEQRLRRATRSSSPPAAIRSFLTCRDSMRRNLGRTGRQPASRRCPDG